MLLILVAQISNLPLAHFLGSGSNAGKEGEMRTVCDAEIPNASITEFSQSILVSRHS
jgi:hypothetical protein